jgi:hypothetical protein
MPSASYRRKLRNNIESNKNIGITYSNNSVSSNNDSNLILMQKYFLNMIDLLIKQNSYSDIMISLKDKVNYFQSAVDYYKILDIIEDNLLSIVTNICDDITPSVIELRICYVRQYIDQLPPNFQDVGPVAALIMEIIKYIEEAVDFRKIESELTNIQTFIKDKYGNHELYAKIYKNFIDIVENISEEIAPSIIDYRLIQLKDIIDTL